MKQNDFIKERLFGAMDSGMPFVTREDLARFGSALIAELQSVIAGANDEYETRGKLARRYHLNPETLSRLCEKHHVRTIRKNDVGYVRYNVGDVCRALTQN